MAAAEDDFVDEPPEGFGFDAEAISAADVADESEEE